MYLLSVGSSPTVSSFLYGPSFSVRLAQQVDFCVRVLGFGLYNLVIFATYKASQQSIGCRVWMDECEYSWAFSLGHMSWGTGDDCHTILSPFPHPWNGAKIPKETLKTSLEKQTIHNLCPLLRVQPMA